MADVTLITPEVSEPKEPDNSEEMVATGIAIAESEHATVTAEEAVDTAEIAVVTAEETQGELEEVKFDIGGMESRIVGAIDTLRDATERGLLLIAELVDKPAPEPEPEPQKRDTPPKQDSFYQKRLWGNK